MTTSGDTIGRYRLIRQLGAGGMGTVWLAARADGAFERDVALKLLHPDLGAGEPMARFQREREILGGLDSPSIARILDAGMTDAEQPYFVMEAIDGLPIDQYCRRAELRSMDRVRLLARAARAVGHAHERHVIHRDIKPGNVLVTAEGDVKLIDFGVASWQDRPLGRDAFVTQGPLRFLTKEYAAPEQLEGGKVTAPSDVYALGALGHEMLFDALPAGGEVSEDCTGDLRLVLEGALNGIPEERYANAALLADDLERVVRGSPVKIKALGRWGRARRWLRHHRDVAAVLAGSLLILAVSFVIASADFRAARASLARSKELQESTTTMADRLRSIASEQLTTFVKAAPPGHARERLIVNMSYLAKRVGGPELTLACATASLDLAEHWSLLCSDSNVQGDEAKVASFRSRMAGMLDRAEALLASDEAADDSEAPARQRLSDRAESLRDSVQASRLVE